ncbi:MAG: aldo/keto reductase [Pseudomonadales bacterium]
MLEPVQLGANSGLRVSPLCLGTMNFGEPGRGHQGDWTLGIDDAEVLFKAALEAGICYFDCANVYGVGASEQVVGELLQRLARREDYVLTTKVSMPMGRGANAGGLSRKHIIESIDASLMRLGHDYVDQLIIHRHPHAIPGASQTPIEETLEALDEVVKMGKALYLGASSMFAWQFAQLQLTAQMQGWTQFISMQNHYNLVYREEEREMIPYCLASGVAVTPWSPLARGILAGAYKGGLDQGTTKRSQGQDMQRTKSLYHGDAVFPIAERVMQVAEKYGKSPAQIAIAWLLHKPGVVSPVVGVSKLSQLQSLVEAVTIELEAEDLDFLESLYRPVENLLSSGFS